MAHQPHPVMLHLNKVHHIAIICSDYQRSLISVQIHKEKFGELNGEEFSDLFDSLTRRERV